MGIIDLNIERPAWKRTDVVEAGEETPEETPASESRGRLGRTGRVTAGVAVAAVSLLTLRRLRSRRRRQARAASDEDE